jgi:hypothetical protein
MVAIPIEKRATITATKNFMERTMKYLLLALTLLCNFVFAKDVYIKPHTRSDGTYVQGHYRTAPNSSQYDNYSTKGNYNPYTGQAGTVEPQPTYQSPSYPNNRSSYDPYNSRGKSSLRND